MDRDFIDVCPFKGMYLAARRFLGKFQDKFDSKFFHDGSEMVEKELRMMILASDCSVTPLGRIFEDGKLCGIIMPYETPIIPPSSDRPYMHLAPPNFSRSDKLRFINQLIPFADVDDNMIEDVIKSGGRPDLTLIDDTMAAELIVSYLDCGDRSLHESISL
jgi:hypothetical protein